MIPIPPGQVSFIPEGYGYHIIINGIEYASSDVMHFTLNPDPQYPWKGQGITAAVKDIANNLKQAAATEKAFMESKWKPSIIIKVDGLIDEFSSRDGRKKLIDEYISTNDAGEPLIIPADQFSVEQIRPLTLGDLAIKDTVEIDKKTVAAILGVPPFVLGVGNYNSAEWNNFISGTIKPIAEGIEQEMTRKLLISPKWYWRFNVASLYSYDLKTTADVYSNLYVRGIVDGNEVRDKLSMSPRDGLDSLVILENYIPLDKIGDQLKLKQGGNIDGQE
jgi:HK97 family phage portal protein